MSKQNMQSKSKKQVQQAVLGLLLLSKEATFDLKSTFTLNIDNGVCIVDFAEDELDFSPDGYDERDPDDDFVDSDPWRGGPEGDMFG